ncbi:DUF2080 family transposase-associated protein [Methanothermococcus thermolithotrophicus]|uniref:DUF2080 family transposase-associated protein n=1 Tax=Methanothermococcus thermolithotrophicus TaxID=2186 RepID=UPI00037C07E7|nr:DUF2080 family transposase-associated protein [Methanothermococcus thermolithotrophicus]
MAQFELIKTIKPIGNTGHITIPKKFIGKQARIIIENENAEEKEKQIINFLKERKKAKILTTFYISGFGLYSDFILFINELEKKGVVKKEGDYLKLIEG